jgi:hypothetical protein
MIVTKTRITTRLSRSHLIEGWIERVDLQNHRVHVRTGSRDKFGVCVHVPDECTIHHESHELTLHSLLPCDAVNIHYLQDEHGARIAHRVELTP